MIVCIRGIISQWQVFQFINSDEVDSKFLGPLSVKMMEMFKIKIVA